MVIIQLAILIVDRDYAYLSMFKHSLNTNKKPFSQVINLPFKKKLFDWIFKENVNCPVHDMHHQHDSIFCIILITVHLIN